MIQITPCYLGRVWNSCYRCVHPNAPTATDAGSHQLTIIDKQVFGATVEGPKVIFRLINRYAIFQDLYLHGDTTARGELEALLIGLYAEVLLFLAKSVEILPVLSNY